MCFDSLGCNRDWRFFSVRHKDVNALGFVSHIAVSTTQLCCCGVKGAVDDR